MAAVIAVSVALIPSLAQAADSPSTAAGTSAAVTADLTKAGASNFHTFSSPESKAIRAQKQSTAPKSRAATTGKTIYASTSYPSCQSEIGTGTQNSPFCKVQDAVDAAQPGDTVDVFGYTGYFSSDPVTVKTSGISIVGTSDQSWIQPTDGKPALILDHVTGVTVSNMMLTTWNSSAVQIIGSSNITLDSSYLTTVVSPSGTAFTGLTIDGASSNVTVSRTFVGAGVWAPGSKGISVAVGASQITLASDVLVAGISATGVSGLNVVGNTIQRDCDSGIDVEGTSTNVHLENNLLEDTDPAGSTSSGSSAKCAAAGQTWAPHITVSAGSSAGTTADYNDFSTKAANATAPYSWAGTAYPTLAGFLSGTTEGAHDTVDTVQPTPVVFRMNGPTPGADARLVTGSAAIGSANPNAPGALSTDFYGYGQYTSRGAIQFLGGNPTMALSVTGEDTSAYGVSITANVTSAAVPLIVTFDWGDGLSDFTRSTGSGKVPWSHHYAKLGKYTVTVTVSDSTNDVLVNTVTVQTAGSDYTAYGPTRLLDTRTGGVAQVKAGATTRLQIGGTGGAGGVPVGVDAAVLNITVTNPTTSGFISAFPEGAARPSTSNVNFTAGQTVPNLSIVPVGANGYVDLYNSGIADVDLVVDIDGYFTPSASSGYTPVAPTRLVDTRDGTGFSGGQIGGRTHFNVKIAGGLGGNLPPSGITAVALNITSTGSWSPGFLTAYPDGVATPTASNVNYSAWQTVANSVIAPVGANGLVDIFNGGVAPTDVVVDVVGYYSLAGPSAYLPVTPQRLLDTRDASWGSGPLAAGDYIYMPLGARDTSITGFVLNTTVTETKGGGFLTVSPDPNTLASYQGNYASWPIRPTGSSLNWLPGQTVANLVQATPGYSGIIDVWNTGSGSTQLVVDAFGYYQNY